MKSIPLIAVVGPTASGKTQLGIQLAQQFGGEIISSDSRQIYRHMDIGTAKPSFEERIAVPHYLIDFINPDQTYNAGQFQNDADKIIQKLYDQKKVPVILGGTGLYLRALIHGMIPVPEIRKEVKQSVQQLLQEQGLSACYQKLVELDPISAQQLHPNDISRVLRALEVMMSTGKSIKAFQEQHQFQEERYPVFWIGVQWDREKLYERINQRVQFMVEEGLIEETKKLQEMGYHKDHIAIDHSIGHKQAFIYLEGKMSLEEMIEDIQQKTRRYAKKQLTWYRRDKKIHWLQPKEDFNVLSQEIQVFLSENLRPLNQ